MKKIVLALLLMVAAISDVTAQDNGKVVLGLDDKGKIVRIHQHTDGDGNTVWQYSRNGRMHVSSPLPTEKQTTVTMTVTGEEGPYRIVATPCKGCDEPKPRPACRPKPRCSAPKPKHVCKGVPVERFDSLAGEFVSLQGRVSDLEMNYDQLNFRVRNLEVSFEDLKLGLARATSFNDTARWMYDYIVSYMEQNNDEQRARNRRMDDAQLRLWRNQRRCNTWNTVIGGVACVASIATGAVLIRGLIPRIGGGRNRDFVQGPNGNTYHPPSNPPTVNHPTTVPNGGVHTDGYQNNSNGGNQWGGYYNGDITNGGGNNHH